MSNAQPVPLLGRLAVHHKFITMDELTTALREAGRPGEERKLGDVLVDLGLLSPTDLQKLVVAQRKVLEKHRAKLTAAGVGPPSGGLVEKRSAPKTAAEPLAAAPDIPDATPATEAQAPNSPPQASERVASEPPAEATAAPKRTPRSTSAAPGGAIDDVLRRAVDQGASDIHIHAGTPLRARIAGNLVDLAGGGTSEDELLFQALDSNSRAELERAGEVDFCYSLEGVGRFRANVYREQRGLDGVFRHIPPTPPSLESLGLPQSLAKFTTYHQGMVLVTGPTGCGKTSTLAALVDLINNERKDHILTIEDPIEYLHTSKRCLVNQRSVTRHTQTFARALRAALREDPDVIVIGELRDLETISLALSAAETGHLVLATLHTDNTMRTLNRIVGAFPADQQEQVRTMISESLRAVISQRLVNRADGNGRVPAIETLVVNKAIGNLIRDNKVFQIHSILQTGGSQGMGLLDQSLKAHLTEGTITKDEALKHASDPKIIAA